MKTKFNGILTLLLALVVQINFAQEKTISGTVSDENGPLPGVSVLKKGTAQGTETDFDGNYSIKAKTGDVLVFSFVGMETTEKVVGTLNSINVIMQGENVLDEIIVTAIGIKRKPKELSYSVSTVKNDDITETKSVNTANALIGKVSGLNINVVNNGVNPNTRVLLRGNRSLLNNNQALIVVDGYPAPRGVLDRINPNDIKDVTVLKGANASALYGSEASNGVVILTTKKGNSKLNIEFNSVLELEEVSFMPEVQEEFGAGGFPDGTLYPLENVAWGPRLDGRLVDASETLDNGDVWKVPYSPIKDNHKSFFETGLTTRNGITISSGDENSNILFSLDHTDKSGIVPKDKYNRTNVRLNAGRKVGKLEINGNFSFFRSFANTVSSVAGRQNRPLYWAILNTPVHIPITKMKNWKDGKYTRNEVSYYRFYENPYFLVDTKRDKLDLNEFTFIGSFKYSFNDWISASFRGGYTNSDSNFKRELGPLTYAFHLKKTYAELDAYGASTKDEMKRSNRLNTDFIISIDKKLNDNFSLKANIGHNMRIDSESRADLNGDNLIIPDFYNVSTRKGELKGSQYKEQYRKIGVYGDFTFGFKDFLFLNASIRNDWSSSLSRKNRSFYYPGGGFSLLLSEAFPSIVSEKGLSYLKLSGNITKSGNDPDAYQNSNIFYTPTTKDNVDRYNFPYGSIAGLARSSRDVDQDIKPEFTTSLEAGLEFGLLNNRITSNISFYKTNTVDQIIPVNISTASGATRKVTNLGELENIGLEVDLNTSIFRDSEFKWDLGLNYSGYTSTVVSLSEGINELEIGGFNDATVVAKVGEAYPQIKATVYERTPNGRVIVDNEGDPIKSSTMKTVGKTTPDFVLGLNTTLKYKNLKLYAVADYRTGHVFYNGLVNALEFTGLTKHSVTSGRQPFVFPNSSYSDGNGGYIENTDRLTSGGGNAFWKNYGKVAENYVTDASVLKIREISLSYDFNAEVLKPMGMSGLTFGIYSRNPFMFKPKENVYTDPEFNYSTGNVIGLGSQRQTAPTRQFGFRLTAKF